jgi:hypothetical protein
VFLILALLEDLVDGHAACMEPQLQTRQDRPSGGVCNVILNIKQTRLGDAAAGVIHTRQVLQL